MLNSYCFVLHRRTPRHHRDGLIALRLLGLLLDCLNGLVLLVLLLHEMLLLHFLVLRVLLDFTLLDTLIIARSCGRCIFNAHRWLYVMNYSLMGRQLGFRSKSLPTVQTCVWSVCVLTHMRYQRSLLQELLPTHRTLVGHTPVNLAMIHQLEFSRERCSAILTDEWIQASMET